MKYVILSTDSSKEYFELLPLVCYSWGKLDVDQIIITVDVSEKASSLLYKYCPDALIGNYPCLGGIRNSTTAQIKRLFVSSDLQITPAIKDDDVLITSDADMVIAKDIFTHEGDVISYGHDLTGRGDLPMCYIEASVKKWRELMGECVMPNSAYSNDWAVYWETDQKLLTKKAKEYGFGKIKFIDRGNNNKHGLPTGRWDRHDWSHIPADIIDVHMKRNDFDAQLQVFKHLWPDDDYQFLIDFKNELNQIL